MVADYKKTTKVYRYVLHTVTSGMPVVARTAMVSVKLSEHKEKHSTVTLGLRAPEIPGGGMKFQNILPPTLSMVKSTVLRICSRHWSALCVLI